MRYINTIKYVQFKILLENVEAKKKKKGKGVCMFIAFWPHEQFSAIWRLSTLLVTAYAFMAFSSKGYLTCCT
jgi:hypothetical protein